MSSSLWRVGRIASVLCLLWMSAFGAVTIDVSSLPDAYVWVEYSYKIPVSGMTASDECKFLAGSWPSGMLMNPRTCLVEGRSYVSGTYTFQLAVVNGNATLASRTLTFSVKGDLKISYPASWRGKVGQYLSWPAQVDGGTPPMTFSLHGGTMPPGISLNPSTGTVSGTPTVRGSYSPQIRVTDSQGLTGYGQVTFLFDGLVLELIPDPVTSSRLPDMKVGYPTSFQFGARGGVPPYRFETRGLIEGMNLSASGLLSGMMFWQGQTGFDIQAWDSNDNQSGYAHYNWSVLPGTAMAPTAPALAEGLEGTAYAQVFTATGMGAGITVAATGMVPPGLTLSMTGPNTAELHGTPTLGGLYEFTVRFTDSGGAVAFNGYYMRVRGVGPTLTITTSSLPQGQVGAPYSARLEATGGKPPYSFSVQYLVAGLVLNPLTGEISGTPTEPWHDTLHVTVKDETREGPSRGIPLEIKASSLVLSHTPIPEAWPYAQYREFGINCANAIGLSTIEVVSGAIPTGLSLVNDGLCRFIVRGIPTQSGVFNPRVKISDSLGVTGTLDLSIPVRVYTLTILPLTAPDGIMHANYFLPLSATGGTPPYRFFIISGGSLLSGFDIRDGAALAGHPPAGAVYTGRVGVEDASGARGERLYSIRVIEGGLTINGTLPQMTFRQSYAAQLSASGGTPPYRFLVLSGAFPEGITMSEQGLVSGIPTKQTWVRVEIGVTDAASKGGSRLFDVEVIGPTLTIGPNSLPTGESAKLYSVQLTASGGRPPYRFTLTQSPLWPAGLSIAQDGVLSGTHVTGQDRTYSFLVSAEDADGLNGAKWMSLLIKGVADLHLGPEKLPAGAVGASYSTSVYAGGGTAPYAFSILSGALPAGITLLGTGQIAGLAQQPGVFDVMIGVRDSTGATASKLYSITVAGSGLTLSPAYLPPGTAGQPYSQPISVSGGQSPYSFQQLSGTLPSGLVFGANGVLSGTPRTAGSWPLRIKASDFSGLSVEKDYTLEIVSGDSLQILPVSLPRAKVGVAFEAQLSCSGGQGECQFSAAAGTLPPGIELVAGARLRGTPSRMGESRFSIDARDQSGAQARREFVLDADGVALLPERWKAVATGVPVTEQMTVEPQLAGVQFRIASGTLPAGITLSTSGELRGTANVAGSWTVVVEALWNGSKAGSRIYLFETAEPLRLVTGKLYRAQAGVFFRTGLEARGGRPPYVYAPSEQLPAGLRLDSDGTISGTVQATGDYVLNVTVTDSVGLTHSGAVTLKIEKEGVKITTTWLPEGRGGQDYSAVLLATGGAGPYVWSILTGILPDSIQLSSDGRISGRPTQPWTINFTVQAVDAEGREARQLLTLAIKPATPEVGLFTAQPGELRFRAEAGSPVEQSGCISVYVTGQLATVRANPPASGTASWLRLSNAEAVTPGLICLAVNPAQLSAGQFRETIRLTANSATPSEILIPVQFDITVRPEVAISVLPSSLRLRAAVGAGMVKQTLHLFNEGSNEVTVSATTDGGEWLNSPQGPWTLQPQQILGVDIEADPSNLSPGLYSSGVTFSAGGASAGARIELLAGAAERQIETDRSSLSFAAWLGADNPQPQAVLVRNVGFADAALDLSVAGEQAPGWLSMAASGCGAPGTVVKPGESCVLSVGVLTQDLEVGTYQAVVRASGGTVPVDLLVTLTVLGQESVGRDDVGGSAVLFVRNAADADAGQEFVLPGPPARKGPVQWVVSGDGGAEWLKVTPAELSASATGTVTLNLAVDWAGGLRNGVNRAVLRLAFADGSSQSIHAVALSVAELEPQTAPAERAASACETGHYGVILAPTPDFRATKSEPITISTAVFDCSGAPADGLEVYARLGENSHRLKGDGQGRYSSALTPDEASDRMVLSIAGWLPGAAKSAQDELVGKVREVVLDGPVVSLVLNGMGLKGPVVPDSWIMINGRGLTSTPAEDPALPDQLAGVKATLGGVPLALQSVNDAQIVTYVPAALASGSMAALVVESGGRTAAPYEVAVSPYAPLLYAGDGSNVVLGWCEDTVETITAESPAPYGSILHVYGSSIDTDLPVVVMAGTVEISDVTVTKLEGHPGFRELVFRLPADLGKASGIELKVLQGTLASNTVVVPVRK